MKKFLFKHKYLITLLLLASCFWTILDETSFLYDRCLYVDLNIFYNIGKGLANGKELYKDLLDVKGPYTYFIGALSYKIFNTYTLYYLFNLLSVCLYIFSNFKICKIYLDEKKSFLVTLFSFILMTFLVHPGNTENMIIGFISYFIYWILSDGFNKDNSKVFIFFGYIFCFIFYTKLNYLLGFGIVAIYYIVYNIKIKEYKKLMKDISIFILSILFFSIPVLIYEIRHDSLFYVIPTYLKLAFGYAGDFKTSFIFTMNNLCKICFSLLFQLFGYIYLFFETKHKKVNIISSILFIFGIYGSIVCTLSILNYYLYIIFPFFIIIFIAVFKKDRIFKKIVLIFGYIFVIFSTSISFMYFSTRQVEPYYQMKEEFEEELKDSTLVCTTMASVVFLNYLDSEPQYRNFFGGESAYEKGKINEDIKDGKIDYILALTKDNSYTDCMQWCNLEIFKYIADNYEIVGCYEVDDAQNGLPIYHKIKRIFKDVDNFEFVLIKHKT